MIINILNGGGGGGTPVDAYTKSEVDEMVSQSQTTTLSKVNKHLNGDWQIADDSIMVNKIGTNDCFCYVHKFKNNNNDRWIGFADWGQGCKFDVFFNKSGSHTAWCKYDDSKLTDYIEFLDGSQENQGTAKLKTDDGDILFKYYETEKEVILGRNAKRMIVEFSKPFIVDNWAKGKNDNRYIVSLDMSILGGSGEGSGDVEELVNSVNNLIEDFNEKIGS